MPATGDRRFRAFAEEPAPRRARGRVEPGGQETERPGLELLMGLEPMTSSLPRKCSTTELQQPPARGSRPDPRGTFALAPRSRRPVVRGQPGGRGVERAMGIEPTRSAWKADVLPLNYARRRGPEWRPGGTRTAPERRRDERAAEQLAWMARTRRTVARPPRGPRGRGPGVPMAKCPEVVGGAGFEPAKALPSDLQSDPFGHSGIPPSVGEPPASARVMCRSVRTSSFEAGRAPVSSDLLSRCHGATRPRPGTRGAPSSLARPSPGAGQPLVCVVLVSRAVLAEPAAGVEPASF